MTRLVLRNLFQNPVRLVISIGGVALALMLILSLDAIFAGVEKQITAYINNSGADVFVSQVNVRNMHMASSSLPVTTIEQTEAVQGVASVTPILYLPNVVIVGEERNLAYIIGVPENAPMGGPWDTSEGRGNLAPGEAVIDRNVAEKSGAVLGDSVEILGAKFKLVGLSEGTASLTNSVAFIAMSDFAGLRRSLDTVSYLLIKARPGQSPEELAARIESQVPAVTAGSTKAFATQEKTVVKDMSTDVVAIMNLVGFLIGLAVMAITVYTATFAHRKEYGVLKALGARNGFLYSVVMLQALFSVVFGFAIGLAFTLLISWALPVLGVNLALVVSSASLLKVSSASLVIATLSAILPIRQIAGLDPALVFRGK